MGPKLHRHVLLAAALLAVVATAAVARAEPGDSDGSLSKDGYATVEIGGASPPLANFDDMALQADGKILLSGTVGENSEAYYPQPVVTRLNQSGSTDTGFGKKGQTLVEFPAPDDAVSTSSVAALPDGRVLVGAGGQNIDLARLSAVGRLDTTFSGDGLVSLPLPGYDSASLSDLVVSASGAIVVGGVVRPAGSEDTDVYVARLTTDGALDPTFSGDGFAVDARPGAQRLIDMALAADGSVTIAGSSGSSADARPLVARFTPAGLPDAGFAAGGAYLGSAEGSATGVALDGSGGTLVSTTGSSKKTDMVVVRLTAAGLPDPAFGTGGTARASFDASAIAADVVAAPDGSVVAVGSVSDRGQIDFALARLTAAGTLDTGFSGDGLRVSDLRCGTDYAIEGALDSQGRILAAGNCERGIFGGRLGTSDFAVARYVTGAGPGDEDADGVADKSDECKGSFGPKKAKGKRPAGCPDVDRRITGFTIKGRTAKGTIDAADTACAVGQRVSLFRSGPGKDRKVGRTRPKGNEIKLKLPKGAGGYYAQIEANLEPDGGLCATATSKVKRAG